MLTSGKATEVVADADVDVDVIVDFDVLSTLLTIPFPACKPLLKACPQCDTKYTDPPIRCKPDQIR